MAADGLLDLIGIQLTSFFLLSLSRSRSLDVSLTLTRVLTSRFSPLSCGGDPRINPNANPNALP
eukprot:1144725-Amorphochlora_amoeboformis.AAC.1